MEKVSWGILSTARIGVEKVIPAFLTAAHIRVEAIASRTKQKAEEAARKLGIPTSYGSYGELLEDPGIDAVYIPIPNSLHAEWTIRAMEAGKHVLCEKPLALTPEDAGRMIEVRDRTGVKAGEAFMVRSAPQWKDTRDRIRRGGIGELRMIQGFFSYFNDDPGNIRNIPELGGGGIWDIGCYCVTMSRYLFGEEPRRLVSALEFDPEMKTDRLASVLMEFPSGQSHFGVSTQLVPYQRMHMLGTQGHLEVRIPFNAPNDRPLKVAQDEGDILLEEIRVHSYPAADQYRQMGEDFSRAILEDSEVPVTLEDAWHNTRAMEAVFKSAEIRGWVEIPQRMSP